MNGQPNKKQKDWHNWLRSHGCAVTGAPNPTIQHIKGARMRLKGVAGFAGEWYCYGLCYELHLGGGPDSLAVSKKSFEASYRTEKEIWQNVVRIYESERGHKPMSEEEYQIILDRA